MRNFYVFLYIAGIAVIFGSSSCNVINPAEVVPTYVHIDSFSFTGTPSLTGSNSHKITNVYVYFNNAPVGVFDLPVTFPVIATAPGTLTVLPGIDFDGLTGYEVIYSLYDGDLMSLTPTPGKQINYTPTTHYNANVVPQILDDFEQGIGPNNTFKYLSGDTTLVNINTPSEVFEGAGSGLFRLTPGKDSATVISKAGKYIAPQKGAFLEIDYKGNIPLQIGLSVTLSGGDTYTEYLIALKPRTGWGKIYVGLDEFLTRHQGPEYRILLHTVKPADVTDGFVYVDNVKVVSFKN